MDMSIGRPTASGVTARFGAPALPPPARGVTVGTSPAGTAARPAEASREAEPVSGPMTETASSTLQRLADERAALLCVADLVAGDASPQEVLDAVAAQAAQL